MDITALISCIAQEGERHSSALALASVAIFKNMLDAQGNLQHTTLDETDGSNISRRELLARFLLLSAVIDQGPDIQGVHALYWLREPMIYTAAKSVFCIGQWLSFKSSALPLIEF